MYVIASIGSSSGSGSIVGPSNALYVDIAGDDATGTRGNAARPFLTIAAALAAQASDNDEIMLSPGTFSVTTALSVGAQKGVTVRGSGIDTTFLSAIGAVDIFDLSTAGLTQAAFSDLTMSQAGTGQCLSAVGTSASLLSTGLICDRVRLQATGAATNAIDFTYVNVALFNDCVITGSISLVTCGAITFRGTTQAGTSLITTWDNTNVLAPGSGQSLTSILDGSSMVATVALTGQARLTVDKSSTIANLTGLNMSVAAGPVSPAVRCYGSITGTTDFTSTAAKRLPSAVLGAYTMDFSGCTFFGASATFCVASGATRQNIILTGAVAGGLFTLTADALTDISARGAAFSAPTYASANTGALGIGTIVPSKLVILATAAIADTTIAFGFTAGNTNYAASFNCSAAAATPLTRGAKNATDFHITVGGAPGGTIDAIVEWQ